ncbi:hypothetical protein [uncultured Roseibium sp.]|uniref:hypothetical protein n=1 Tax=uncultured Roseibium sp. TaxID=1936171 RepID=UPI00261F511D|nr:hypothetical protein [uncultured Roseibium sp.]
MTKVDFSKRDEFETKLHQMTDAYIVATRNGPKGHVKAVDIIVLNTFKAQYWAALSLERIKMIGYALSLFEISEDAYKQAITRLIRAKVLRRSKKDKKLVEVNY